jgi:cysteinyl-tRNA synthetase
VFFYLDEIIYLLNIYLDKQEEARELAGIFYFILEDILGFKFELVNYDSQIRYLLDEWQRLRQNKQFLEADQIRRQLQEADVI